MEWLKGLVVVPVCIVHLYLALLCVMMTLRYGLTWYHYEKAWDEIDTF